MIFLLCIVIAIIILSIIGKMLYSNFLLFKGINFLNKGDNIKAIEIFSKLSYSHVKYYKSIAYSSRATARLNIGMYKESFHDLLKSLNLMKVPEGNLVSVARLLGMFKEYDIAIKYISKANELKPKSSTINFYLGRIYYQKGEYEKAIEIFNTTLQYDSAKNIKSQIYSSLAESYFKLKDFDKATSYMFKSFDFDTENPNAHRVYANLLKLQGNLLKAKDEAIKSIEISSNQYIPYRILAEINLIEEKYTDFYTNFRKYLEKKPLSEEFDYESINDSIYDKVRNHDQFNILIENNTKETTALLNNLKIGIFDDNKLLEDHNNKKNNNKIILIATSILIILIALVLNLHSTKSNGIKTVSGIDRVYAVYNLDKNKVIKNSNKYSVIWQTTNVKAGEKINFKIDGQNLNINKILAVQKYGDILAGSDVSVNNHIGIDSFKTTNNKINVYVFIEPKNETNIYEYDYTLTEYN